MQWSLFCILREKFNSGVVTGAGIYTPQIEPSNLFMELL